MKSKIFTNSLTRCWAYETSLLLDTPISNDLPCTDYFEYFAPDYTLHPDTTTKIENQVTIRCLQQVVWERQAVL